MVEIGSNMKREQTGIAKTTASGSTEPQKQQKEFAGLSTEETTHRKLYSEAIVEDGKDRILYRIGLMIKALQSLYDDLAAQKGSESNGNI